MKQFATIVISGIVLLFSSLKTIAQDKGEMKHVNELISETSPYLLQHANNPVNWHAWNEVTLDKAKKENKLLLISIGYSSCHWCHVMEHESFEDESVAEVMNKYFINVKVDREERPDVDQVYMTAVQLMTGRGGWPLNCVALPDGRPVWGGTYFRKGDWINVLRQIADLYHTDPQKMLEYAESLEDGIKQAEGLIPIKESINFTKENLDEIVVNWSRRYDQREGGPDKAPKFPLPNNYQFLLDYGVLSKSGKTLEHVKLTLDKMAQGGIYDQVGGGFARYSTDALWKVPHFEKMLYDNAQLVSLYANAYRVFEDDEYRQIVCQTLAFIEREMTGPDGEFYSALDADSEGEEGKFYIWKKEELQELIPKKDWKLFENYYSINRYGHWEESYILLRRMDDSTFAEKFEVKMEDLQVMVDRWNNILLAERASRVRPGLDDKSLTSWNALMIGGYIDAYLAIGEQEFLDKALENAVFIRTKQLAKDGKLYHSYKKGRSTIDGFLEDYAAVVDAYLKLYAVTSDEDWLNLALLSIQYVKEHFEDKNTEMFFFTSNLSEKLISRSVEKEDNVIPSSNSMMARNLFVAGHYTGNLDWIDQSKKMSAYIHDNIYRYGEGYSNWALLALGYTYPYYEIAISGENGAEIYQGLNTKYRPNVIYAWSDKESKVPLLEERFVKGKTLIYVCQDQVCKMPVEEVLKAEEFLKYE